jgi:hypothetical protein
MSYREHKRGWGYQIRRRSNSNARKTGGKKRISNGERFLLNQSNTMTEKTLAFGDFPLSEQFKITRKYGEEINAITKEYHDSVEAQEKAHMIEFRKYPTDIGYYEREKLLKPLEVKNREEHLRLQKEWEKKKSEIKTKFREKYGEYTAWSDFYDSKSPPDA